jgi:(2R)-ethylmalonyl-CoA mutase
MDRVQAMGGAIAAVESGYMKQRARVLPRCSPRSHRGRDEIIVGVNKFETTEQSR